MIHSQLRRNVHFGDSFTVEVKCASWFISTPRCSTPCIQCQLFISRNESEYEVMQSLFVAGAKMPGTCSSQLCVCRGGGGWKQLRHHKCELCPLVFLYHFPVELLDVCSQLCSCSGIWLGSPPLLVSTVKIWVDTALSQMTAVTWVTCFYMRRCTPWHSRVRWTQTKRKKWLCAGWW